MLTEHSLADALSNTVINDAVLYKRHGPFLQLGRRLLGVQSNIYGYMEIWPIAFRTYNLMVPNFFNIPVPLLGITPDTGLLGTAMYASSRAAQCMYCSAHSCTIAQRGGANVETLEQILYPEQQSSEAIRSVLKVAAGMSTIPPSLAANDIKDLHRHYGSRTADWVVYAVAMMGFLNKMMDSMGVALEADLVAETTPVAGASGWTPGRHRVVQDERPLFDAKGRIGTLLSMLPFMPSAILQDARWTRGIPSKADKAVALLQKISGYNFPMIARIRQKRVVRSLTTMLRDNLSATESKIGLATKHMAGVVFSIGLGNEELQRGAEQMAQFNNVDNVHWIRELGLSSFSLEDAETINQQFQDVEPPLMAALLLAKAMSSSPANMTPAVIKIVVQALAPAEIIELVTWLSLLSLLHRLHVVQVK